MDGAGERNEARKTEDAFKITEGGLLGVLLLHCALTVLWRTTVRCHRPCAHSTVVRRQGQIVSRNETKSKDDRKPLLTESIGFCACIIDRVACPPRKTTTDTYNISAIHTDNA